MSIELLVGVKNQNKSDHRAKRRKTRVIWKREWSENATGFTFESDLFKKVARIFKTNQKAK